MAPQVIYIKESISNPTYITCLPVSLAFEKDICILLLFILVTKIQNANNNNTISINNIEKKITKVQDREVRRGLVGSTNWHVQQNSQNRYHVPAYNGVVAREGKE